MNDESNREVVTIMFRATKFTAQAVAEAMARYLHEIKEEKKYRARNKVAHSKPKEKHGKMKLEELMKQNQGAVTIEIPRDGVGDFVKIAKHYHVDFSVKKSANTKPPTYMCFFKSKDKDVMEAAFKAFIQKQEVKNSRQSFKQVMKEAKAEARRRKVRTKGKNKNRSKEKEVSR